MPKLSSKKDSLWERKPSPWIPNERTEEELNRQSGHRNDRKLKGSPYFGLNLHPRTNFPMILHLCTLLSSRNSSSFNRSSHCAQYPAMNELCVPAQLGTLVHASSKWHLGDNDIYKGPRWRKGKKFHTVFIWLWETFIMVSKGKK